jgi:NAD(P)H-hydrate epimerase
MTDPLHFEPVSSLPAVPDRPAEGHKGDFGRVVIIGGSRGMSGAVSLAGLGALRGGAGLVFLAVPQGVASTVAAHEPSYLTHALPEDDQGRTSLAARTSLEEAVRGATAVAVGPGWGQSEDLVALLRWLYSTVEVPLVVDADGLNALASLPEFSAGSDVSLERPSGRVLTPHPGEFARLLKADNTSVRNNRESLALRFARTHGVVLLLKGHRTIITDGHRLAINQTGNSGMATGGTGDVLTGLIAALLARGISTFEAALLGAHLHGLAGDLAARELSEAGMIASDLPRYLPQAWKQFEEA